MGDLLPDGVWLNLEAEAYFAQDALGSTDLMGLDKRKLGWWWSSRHNPMRKADDAPHATYGSALHALLLEGLDAYEERYAAPPPFPPGTLFTEKEIKARLRIEGFKLSGVSDWLKEDWCRAMAQNLPRVPVADNITGRWRERTLRGRREISAQDDAMLRLMRDVILDPARTDNADVRKLFAGDGGHPPLAEVSVFYTLPDGLRRRWRIDRMFPRFDLDLKSLGNWGGRPLRWVVGDAIAKHRYHIQRADYHEGRSRAYDLIRDGKLYGGTPEQRQWLRRFPTEFETWDWVWLFYQKPDPTGVAPVVFPVWDDSWEPGGGAHPGFLRRQGDKAKEKALTLYRNAVAEFGLDRPWSRVEPVHYTDDTLDPSVALPSWIVEEDPVEEAAY